MTWVYGTLPKRGRTTWTWRKFGVTEYFDLFKASTPRQRGGEADPTLTLSFTVAERRKDEPTPERASQVVGSGNGGGSNSNSSASGGGTASSSDTTPKQPKYYVPLRIGLEMKRGTKAKDAAVCQTKDQMFLPLELEPGSDVDRCSR
eukprot:SAG25_NODE_3179_length_1185_cov_1.014733_1_plen_146_part_10